jgi:DNA-binding FrmR family transcriptional regulator
MAEESMQCGYADEVEALLNRLRRIEGRVRGVARMVEQDKDCIDIITQISAAQAALDRVALELTREHTKHCLNNSDGLAAGPNDAKANELVDAIGRLIGR